MAQSKYETGTTQYKRFNKLKNIMRLIVDTIHEKIAVD